MTVILPQRPARPIRVEGQTAPDITVQGGRGIPPGGSAGQALIKSSDSNFAATWGSATVAAAWGSVTGTLSAQTDLQGALDAKQDVLVSSTNIKTLNGSTILGSGDLVISASAAWGGITGTLADQTDLNTALGLKADTSSLAAVATSGSASDLSAGTLPAARFDDTAHGSRAGGSLHANAIAGGAAGFMTGADKTKLDGVATGATANSSDATLLNRSNHTGTQTASTISDFDTAVAANSAVAANTAKATNATHTGDVTGSTALTIANDVVTNAKLANMATQTFKGRTTAGTGDPEDLTAAQARTLLNVADGATANASDAALRDRATHTGTQLASTISDFASAVAATAAVTANTAKVSNATHTGDVTGATALTIANDVVTNAKLANVATATIKGRVTAGTGDPEDLTPAQARTVIEVPKITVGTTAPSSPSVGDVWIDTN